jgi:REP element-mobilizing transposase RayT
MLDAERAPAVHAALARKCLELGCVSLAINGMPDHVHVLVQPPPTLAPAVLAKRLKGATSYYLNPHNGLPPSFRWQDGYAVFSVDRASLDRVRRYVQHSSSTTNPAVCGRCWTWSNPPDPSGIRAADFCRYRRGFPNPRTDPGLRSVP